MTTGLERMSPLMQGCAQGYIDRGQVPGHFLMAVLCNDLSAAVAHADSVNAHLLKEWAQWVHWEVPSTAHGSRENVNAWVDKGGRQS